MNLPDNDYVLTDGAGWFDVKGFTLRIHSTDKGLVVDVFDAAVAKTGDFDTALMTSTYVYDHELSQTPP